MTKSSLPVSLYRAAQVRELDRQAIEVNGIPGLTLMQRAGQAAFDVLCQRWPAARQIVVVCGLGNNAGDGYIVAGLAQAAGFRVRVLQLGDSAGLKGDALRAFELMQQAGLGTEAFNPKVLADTDVIVDGLLGTGLDRAVEGEWRLAIEAINQSARPVLALDTPSGLNVDTGSVMGCAVRAEATVTFIGMKQGLLTHAGDELSGDIVFSDLDVPAVVYDSVAPASRCLSLSALSRLLAPRTASSHKGRNGHALIIGGDLGYAGAAAMASEAAARTGAGLTSLATRAEHAALLTLHRPEIMCHGVEELEDLLPLLQRSSSIGIGPGLAQETWGSALFARVISGDLPMVVDADALNLLASNQQQSDHWVLTPHPGEAARLLGCSTEEVQQDRFKAVQLIQQRYGGVCVLKGNGSLISARDGSISLCTLGNPGMASGGMGDVLTGVITGLLAQGLSLEQAAQLGVCLHAAAGDLAARAGQRGLLASDLLPHLRSLVNPEVEINNANTDS